MDVKMFISKCYCIKVHRVDLWQKINYQEMNETAYRDAQQIN
jgi:hypothetical protein